MRFFKATSILFGLALTSCVHAQEGQMMQNKQGAQDKSSGMMSPEMHKMMMSPEMHEKMAKMHQMMANCLKSSTDKNECMKKMKDEHQKMCASMGESCPMMGYMGQMPMNSGQEHHNNHHNKN